MIFTIFFLWFIAQLKIRVKLIVKHLEMSFAKQTAFHFHMQVF